MCFVVRLCTDLLGVLMALLQLDLRSGVHQGEQRQWRDDTPHQQFLDKLLHWAKSSETTVQTVLGYIYSVSCVHTTKAPLCTAQLSDLLKTSPTPDTCYNQRQYILDNTIQYSTT